MSTPTRLSKLGLSGRKQGTDNGASDPYLKQLVIPVTIAASTAQQSTGKFVPAGGAQFLSATINVSTAEASATTPTMDVGYDGTPDAILSNVNVTSTGFQGAMTAGVNAPGGTEIVYKFDSLDFAELSAEIILAYVGSDNE